MFIVHYLYTDIAFVELLLLFKYDVINNDVITLQYPLGVPELFIHIAVIKLIISVENVNW